jgi:hypothetical protein
VRDRSGAITEQFLPDLQARTLLRDTPRSLPFMSDWFLDACVGSNRGLDLGEAIHQSLVG